MTKRCASCVSITVPTKRRLRRAQLSLASSWREIARLLLPFAFDTARADARDAPALWFGRRPTAFRRSLIERFDHRSVEMRDCRLPYIAQRRSALSRLSKLEDKLISAASDRRVKNLEGVIVCGVSESGTGTFEPKADGGHLPFDEDRIDSMQSICVA